MWPIILLCYAMLLLCYCYYANKSVRSTKVWRWSTPSTRLNATTKFKLLIWLTHYTLTGQAGGWHRTSRGWPLLSPTRKVLVKSSSTRFTVRPAGTSSHRTWLRWRGLTTCFLPPKNSYAKHEFPILVVDVIWYILTQNNSVRKFRNVWSCPKIPEFLNSSLERTHTYARMQYIILAIIVFRNVPVLWYMGIEKPRYHKTGSVCKNNSITDRFARLPAAATQLFFTEY